MVISFKLYVTFKHLRLPSLAEILHVGTTHNLHKLSNWREILCYVHSQLCLKWHKCNLIVNFFFFMIEALVMAVIWQCLFSSTHYSENEWRDWSTTCFNSCSRSRDGHFSKKKGLEYHNKLSFEKSRDTSQEITRNNLVIN